MLDKTHGREEAQKQETKPALHVDIQNKESERNTAVEQC